MMTNYCLFAGILALLVTTAHSQTLTTHTGTLRGQRVQTKDYNVDQFLGVPYALPPIGPRRFQKPQPLEPNESAVRDAKSFAYNCVQMQHMKGTINPILNYDSNRKMSEDCLYLNVYAPAINRTNLPVMVWIPGEGFDFSDASQFDFSYLASKGKMIVVTVQYRVGVFGFLKFKDVAPGNMGLWDQVEALRWIRTNVNSFGGDPNKITIAGRFSGSMSISMLITSPLLQKETLFQRAVLMSGVALKEWTFENNPEKKALDLFVKLGCSSGSWSCISSLPSDVILEKSFFFWKPTIDHDLIESYPQDMVSRGQIAAGLKQVLFGSTVAEGHLCYMRHLASKSQYYEKFYSDSFSEEDWNHMIKENVHEFSGSRRLNDCPLCEKAVSIARDGQHSVRDRYLKFCSALYIHLPMENLANLIRSKTNVSTFMYRLHQKASFSILPSFITHAGHGEDVLLLFALSRPSVKLSSSDRRLVENFVQSIANFVHQNGTTFKETLVQPNSFDMIEVQGNYGTLIRPSMSLLLIGIALRLRRDVL